MSIDCARTLHLLQSEGGIHSIPVCDALGNWERKQCRRNYCYCVDTENGIQEGLEYDISEEDKLDCWKTMFFILWISVIPITFTDSAFIK